MDQQPIMDIAVGLVFKDGLFLITKRKPDAHLGDFWEFPGGKVAMGETGEEAVVREVAEEVDLRVSVRKLFHHEVARYPDRTVRLKFFLCNSEAPRSKAKPLTASDLAWVPVEELHMYAFPKGNRTLLEKLAAASAFQSIK